MSDSFPELREILKTGNIPEDTSHFSEACHLRLLDALRDSPGSGDIASVVRHVLRRKDEKQGGISQTLLQVPTVLDQFRRTAVSSYKERP